MAARSLKGRATFPFRAKEAKKMSIGILALTFAAVCGLACMVSYNATEPEKPTRANVVDYAAFVPDEI